MCVFLSDFIDHEAFQITPGKTPPQLSRHTQPHTWCQNQPQNLAFQKIWTTYQLLALKMLIQTSRLKVWSSFSLVLHLLSKVLPGSVYMCHHRVHFRSFQARCHVAHGTRQLMTRSNVSRDTGNYPGGGHRDIAWCAPPPMGCQCVSPIISFIDQNHLMSCLIRRQNRLQYECRLFLVENIGTLFL